MTSARSTSEVSALSPGYWRDPEQTDAAFVPRPASPDRQCGSTGPATRATRGRRRPRLLPGPHRFTDQASRLSHRARRDRSRPSAPRRVSASARSSRSRPTASRARTICCAYVTDDSRRSRSSRCATQLAESLPQYMLPTDWLALDALPKNRNGKIDRPHASRDVRACSYSIRAKPAAARSGARRGGR